jgi:plastocyanin
VTGTARFFWAPASVTIAPGGTVTFAWSGNDFHDLSIPALGIENGTTKSASYTITFPSSGTYSFICEIHTDTMKGTVTVQ